MQTTIDLPEGQLSELQKLSDERQIPRDELIRVAISTYIDDQTIAFDQAFGLWAGMQGDGLEFQQRLRDEW